MPFIWGEFSLFKQQIYDIWQCLNCAPRATRNNLDGWWWRYSSPPRVLPAISFYFFIFCTVNLTLLKQNVRCPLSLAHHLIKRKYVLYIYIKKKKKDKWNNSTLCINNRVRVDCDGLSERLSRFLFWTALVHLLPPDCTWTQHLNPQVTQSRTARRCHGPPRGGADRDKTTSARGSTFSFSYIVLITVPSIPSHTSICGLAPSLPCKCYSVSHDDVRLSCKLNKK